MSTHKLYEAEKRKLQSLNLSPKDYEKAVKALANRLGV